MTNGKSSFLELFALAFLIHIFGLVIYGVIIERIMSGEIVAIPAINIHVILGLIAISCAAIVFAFEKYLKRRLSIKVGKWFCIVSIIFLIGWFVIMPMSGKLGSISP